MLLNCDNLYDVTIPLKTAYINRHEPLIGAEPRHTGPSSKQKPQLDLAMVVQYTTNGHFQVAYRHSCLV